MSLTSWILYAWMRYQIENSFLISKNLPILVARAWISVFGTTCIYLISFWWSSLRVIWDSLVRKIILMFAASKRCTPSMDP